MGSASDAEMPGQSVNDAKQRQRNLVLFCNDSMHPLWNGPNERVHGNAGMVPPPIDLFTSSGVKRAVDPTQPWYGLLCLCPPAASPTPNRLGSKAYAISTDYLSVWRLSESRRTGSGSAKWPLGTPSLAKTLINCYEQWQLS
jgi:hypothetical protein